MKRLATFVAGVVLALSMGASAAVAGTPIGQTGAPANTFWYGGDEIVTPAYVVPAGGGTIVSLNTQSATSCNTQFGFAQGTYDLQVLRPLGANQYMVLGHTGNQIDPCDGQLHSYPVNIPVQAGDVLGVYIVTDWVGALSGDSTIAQAFLPEPAVGDTVTLPPLDYVLSVDESATLSQVPQTKDDCKDGGWQNLVDGSGNPFKNQGDCVSYVATNGKNGGNG